MTVHVLHENPEWMPPFAAAFAVVPVLVMVAYLGAARRTGALENL